MLLFHSFARSPDSGNRDNSYQSCLFMSNSYFYLMKAMENFKMSLNYSKHSEKKKKLHTWSSMLPSHKDLTIFRPFCNKSYDQEKKKNKIKVLSLGRNYSSLFIRNQNSAVFVQICTVLIMLNWSAVNSSINATHK